MSRERERETWKFVLFRCWRFENEKEDSEPVQTRNEAQTRKVQPTTSAFPLDRYLGGIPRHRASLQEHSFSRRDTQVGSGLIQIQSFGSSRSSSLTCLLLEGQLPPSVTSFSWSMKSSSVSLYLLARRISTYFCSRYVQSPTRLAASFPNRRQLLVS